MSVNAKLGLMGGAGWLTSLRNAVIVVALPSDLSGIVRRLIKVPGKKKAAVVPKEVFPAEATFSDQEICVGEMKWQSRQIHQKIEKHCNVWKAKGCN